MDLASGLSQVLNDGTNTYLYGNGRIAQAAGTTTEYFLGDALGSVRQMTNAAGAVTLAKVYDPYGLTTQAGGSGQTSYGFTNEYTSQGLVYLRSRFYSPETGRFLARDTWNGNAQQPMSYNRWNYTNGNPINYIDPSGNITQSEDKDASDILNNLLTIYNARIEKDWGLYTVHEILPGTWIPFIPEIIDHCEWNDGKWKLEELKTIQAAVLNLSSDMGGNYKFQAFIGPITFDKSLGACGRGCTYGGSTRIEFFDKGKPATKVEISNPDTNFDKWTVVHEMGHAWDRHYGWKLQNLLVNFTSGHIGSRPSNCDPGNRLPGCNDAGYFYSFPPPAGSDNNFNPAEDFAESVAAFEYPGEALTRVANIVKENPILYGPVLSYPDYTKNPRWMFINGLINMGPYAINQKLGN